MKKYLFLLGFALFTTFQSLAQTGNKIAFGPYIQQMSQEDAAICWSTPVDGITVTKPDGDTDTIREYKQHTIYLGNLEPNTTYSYDVLNDGSDEGKGTLTTYPEEVIPFNFVAIGDTRTRNYVHKKIEHFINADVKKNNAILHVIDIDGNEFDAITVERRHTK